MPFLLQILRNINYGIFKEIDSETTTLKLIDDIKEEVEILIKYDGYLQRQEQQVETADISVLMVMLKGEG